MGDVINLRSRAGGSGGDSQVWASPPELELFQSQLAANTYISSWSGPSATEIAAAIDETIDLYKSLGVDLSSNQTDPGTKKQSLRMATERELTDAKLEAVEARVEARLAGIEGKIDRLLDRVEDSVSASKEAKTEASLAKTAAGNTKWNILFTGLTVLALVIAVWAIWNQGMELVAGLLSVNSTAGQ